MGIQFANRLRDVVLKTYRQRLGLCHHETGRHDQLRFLNCWNRRNRKKSFYTEVKLGKGTIKRTTSPISGLFISAAT